MQFKIDSNISRVIAIVFFVFSFCVIAVGQHEGHQMPQPTSTPTPAATPSPSPSPHAMGQMEGMHTMGAMDMGPLVVMNGEDMGIRVGSSDTNLISMGAMGSGTAWQPSA